MHALVCCQLAECRPWRQCCTMTCTNMEMTKILFITIPHCLCYLFSLFLSLRFSFSACQPLSIFFFCIFFILLIHGLLNFFEPFPCLLNFMHLTCIFIFVYSPLCFHKPHCFLFTLVSFSFSIVCRCSVHALCNPALWQNANAFTKQTI